MTSAIWMLLYDVANADRDKYLAWFHTDHVAEKLARPGYTWAAHFAGPAASGEPEHTGYIAMFGGDSTRVFLDPAPSQLKQRQDETTRAMMGLRRGGRGLVLTTEWSESAGHGVLMPAMAEHLKVVTADGADEPIGIHCVQTLAPAVASSNGSLTLTKLINVTAGSRHVVMLAADRLLSDADGAMPADTTVAERIGERIWPR
jgi:hypothetical protein